MLKTLLILFMTLNIQADELMVTSYFDGLEVHNQGPYKITYKKGVITNIEKDEEGSKQTLSFLMPPLIDAHVHATSFHPNFKRQHIPFLKADFFRSKKEQRRLTHNFLRDMKNSGFGWLRDLGALPIGKNILREIKKDEHYPYIVDVPNPLVWGRGQCGGNLPCHLAFTDISKMDKSQLSKLLKSIKKSGHHHIKVYADNDPFSSPQMPVNVLLKISQLAKTYKLQMAIHLSESHQLYQVLDKLEAHVSLEHLYHMPKETKTSALLIPTVFPNKLIKEKKDLDNSYLHDSKHSSLALSKNIKLKRRFCFGSDFYFLTNDPVRTQGFYAIESALSYLENGMEMKELLKTMTTHCYSLFNNLAKEKRPGLIRKGNPAHFLILSDSPLKNKKALHNVKGLILSGKKIK